MDSCSNASSEAGAQPGSSPGPSHQQFAMLDMVIPGFSVFSSALYAFSGIDLNLYIPILMVLCSSAWCWRYIYDTAKDFVRDHLMTSVRIRSDDEIFNFVMGWVVQQRFSKSSRHFMASTNINSRSIFVWLFQDDDDDDDDDCGPFMSKNKKEKKLQYTPTYGSHIFWFHGRPFLFDRHLIQNRYSSFSESDEIELRCLSWTPNLLKDLLIEARNLHMAKDENKTPIYRGSISADEQYWKRCMSRSTRPFSTVILNEKVKQDLIEDVKDYLDPITRKWYANRGIPYRRGYLLYGPPGTGKSSLSLALAGYFDMPIYILGLSSPLATEEHVSSLFSSLPRRCVVLLEDIDSAGLTHTREEPTPSDSAQADSSAVAKNNTKKPPMMPGQLSLSSLLNILDGVASQEGRVLIMTTNHLEKLDKALIRPGRVDMTVEFGRADAEMTASIFRAIYAPYEGEETPSTSASKAIEAGDLKDPKEARAEVVEEINGLSREFAAGMPELEFSPAEIQGLLLRNKRDPRAAIAGTEDWIEQTRKDKAEKEIKEAEERRKAEEKRKKEEEKKKKRKAKKKAKKAKAKSKGKSSEKDIDSDSASGSDSDSSDESEDEKEEKTEKVDQKKGTSDSGYGTP